jgi:hypothetical protein
MKLTRQHVLGSVLVLSLCACAQKYQVRGNELAPAADARITARINEKQNVTKLEIDATHLTPPDRLVPDGNAFVIWTKSGTKTAWSRAGSLALKDDGREGYAELTVPESVFDLAITAESDVNVATPSGKTILERHVEDD